MICFKQAVFHIAKGSLKELNRNPKGAKNLIQLSKKKNSICCDNKCLNIFFEKLTFILYKKNSKCIKSIKWNGAPFYIDKIYNALLFSSHKNNSYYF